MKGGGREETDAEKREGMEKKNGEVSERKNKTALYTNRGRRVVIVAAGWLVAWGKQNQKSGGEQNKT